MRAVILGTAVLVATSASADDGPVVPQFREVTATSGLTHSFTGEWEFMVGGGVAVFDCDDDGRQDVYIAGGTAPARFFRNTSAPQGEVRFAEAAAGIEDTGVTGAYPLDIDSDGIMDLVVLRVGANRVMRGLGDCRFADAGDDWHFDGGDAWSVALAATWERGAEWPTIAIGNYIDRTEEFSPWGSCTPNWLHRPAASGPGFAPPEPLAPSWCALSMLFTDWNRSGQPSLRISNDREYYEGGQEQLWHVAPGAAPVAYTPAEGWKPLRIWGMGIASQDVTADGFPDYFLTSMADSKLQVLAGDPSTASYKDIAYDRGVIAQRPYIGDDVRPSTGWHAQFEDVNNDTMADLFIAKGNVSAMPDFADRDPNNLLLQTAGGTFTEAGDTAGVASVETARGAALADFNLDGRLDLLVVNRNSPVQVWTNDGPAGNWLAVRPVQPGANPDAAGGWIEVRLPDGRVMTREMTVGGGHAGGQAGWWHFGLGGADGAEVRVLWPDGTAGPWTALDGNGFWTLPRDGTPLPWQPPG